MQQFIYNTQPESAGQKSLIRILIFDVWCECSHLHIVLMNNNHYTIKKILRGKKKIFCTVLLNPIHKVPSTVVEVCHFRNPHRSYLQVHSTEI